MNRRGFLQGAFGGVTAAGIVICASPDEVAAYTAPMFANEPVIVGTPPQPQTSVGEFVYNERGQVVGVVTEVWGNHYPVNVTRAGDSHNHYIPGTVEINLKVRVFNNVDVTHPKPGTRLG